MNLVVTFFNKLVYTIDFFINTYTQPRLHMKPTAPVIQLVEIGDLKSPQYRFESDSGYHYSYLLGVYLGDGYINLHNTKYGIYKIRITQDIKYPKLIQEYTDSLRCIVSPNVGTVTKNNTVTVYCYSKNLPSLFPQHGSGLKNSRDVSLCDWQMDIITQFPKQFIRGMLHTDGSRYITSDGYMRYNFTNTSPDIIKVFCLICDTLALHYTRHDRPSITPKTRTPSGSIKTTITFNKKQDIELLDSFVGPKE